jgi:hypothetical protein
MSPEDNISSSPKARHSCSSLPSRHLIQEANSHIPKPEIRDVQVDDQVTVTRWSRRHVTRGSDKRSTNIVEWRKKTVETRAPSFDEKEREGCMSKYDIAYICPSAKNPISHYSPVLNWTNAKKKYVAPILIL